MVTRQSPRNLPGMDPLLLQKILLIPFFFLVVVMFALDIVTAFEISARGGHLPWPIAQWALTTPLGTLAIALVGGLVWGLPFLLFLLTQPLVARPVDVTGLPPMVWPRPLPLWRDPPGGTPADYWLGRGRSQRAQSLLALALAALLLIGMLAALIASLWYSFPDCGASGCPPMFDQLTSLPELIGLTIVFLSLPIRVAYVERRCGVWFRVRDIMQGSLSAYVRRPGVTPEAAAAALQRYTRNVRPPIAQLIFVIVLALLPAILVMSGGHFLSVWLATQWLPA